MVGRTSASRWVLARFILVPSDGVLGRFDLAALRHTASMFVSLFVVEQRGIGPSTACG
jgi:hypothetical protein